MKPSATHLVFDKLQVHHGHVLRPDHVLDLQHLQVEHVHEAVLLEGFAHAQRLLDAGREGAQPATFILQCLRGMWNGQLRCGKVQEHRVSFPVKFLAEPVLADVPMGHLKRI